MKKQLLLFLCIWIGTTALAQKVGVNTITPKATLHVKGLNNIDPLIVEYEGKTKLKTFKNGGTSIASDVAPPENGLSVSGTLQPDGGIATRNKLVIESEGNSITLKVGSSTLVLDAYGNITITASGNLVIKSAQEISLSGTKLNLTGNFININAATALTLKGVVATEISTAGIMEIKGALLRLNNGSTPVAKLGSVTAVSGSPIGGIGVVNGETSATVLVP